MTRPEKLCLVKNPDVLPQAPRSQSIFNTSIALRRTLRAPLPSIKSHRQMRPGSVEDSITTDYGACVTTQNIAPSATLRISAHGEPQERYATSKDGAHLLHQPQSPKIAVFSPLGSAYARFMPEAILLQRSGAPSPYLLSVT